MISHFATGPFDVKLAPQTLSAVAEHSGLGRMSIDKLFQAFYERRGFRLTDVIQPYPEGAGVGSPMQSDLLVRSMVKHLSPISG
jgi:hypothetical protein